MQFKVQPYKVPNKAFLGAVVLDTWVVCTSEVVKWGLCTAVMAS